MKTQALTEKQLMGQLMAAIQEPPGRPLKNSRIKTKEKTKPSRTIKSILWSKYLDRIESDGAAPIFWGVVKFVLFFGVTSWLCYPETVASLFRAAMEWRGYLVPKILAAGVLIAHLEILLRVCQYIAIILGKITLAIIRLFSKISFKKNSPKKFTVECINGIPHNELITHLLETGNFKRAEIEAKFAIPRRKYEALAKALEKLGIVKKDKNQNNAFMFVPEFTRQDLANILDGKNDAADLNNFAKQIEKTVILSPTPNFTRNKISKN